MQQNVPAPPQEAARTSVQTCMHTCISRQTASLVLQYHLVTRAVHVQMLGSWPGLKGPGADVSEEQRHQKPQPYNFSIPWKCHLTTVPQMSCTLTHLFAIFSAHLAGLVR